VELSTTTALARAASTSFGGLPVLSSQLARNSFLPRIFTLPGERTVYRAAGWRRSEEEHDSGSGVSQRLDKAGTAAAAITLNRVAATRAQAFVPVIHVRLGCGPITTGLPVPMSSAATWPSHSAQANSWNSVNT
jgi:hypothetical protein